MLRITAEVYPFGDKKRAKQVAQINIANMGLDENRNTKYLYSIQEPRDLDGNTIDIKGMTSFARQANIVGFLRELMQHLDSGMAVCEDDERIIKKMREL